MRVSREDLEGYKEIERIFLHHGRWALSFSVIAMNPETQRVYQYQDDVPATEMQDGMSDWDDPIELTEVVKVEVMSHRWEPVT